MRGHREDTLPKRSFKNKFIIKFEFGFFRGYQLVVPKTLRCHILLEFNQERPACNYKGNDGFTKTINLPFFSFPPPSVRFRNNWSSSSDHKSSSNPSDEVWFGFGGCGGAAAAAAS